MPRTTRRTPAALGAVLAALLLAAPLVQPAPAGAAGSSVRADQRRLAELGCDPGPVDGRFGEVTSSAVVRFQAANDIGQNGRLGPDTRRRLHSGRAVACDRRPVPRGSGEGRRIVLDQSQNWVWLVDARGRAVHQAGIIDNPGELSPGRYSTGPKCGRASRVRRNTSYTGTVALDHFVRFAPCGIGFHRIPTELDRPDDQIHPDWWLGTDRAESAGCVRLSKATARRLWDFTDPAQGPDSTRVVVVR